jgi:nucleotide-binding universal stress UspA family protein
MALPKSASALTFKLIVVGVDFSLGSEQALEEAFLLAAPDATLHLVHVAAGTATELVLDLLEGQKRVNFDEAERHLVGHGRSRAIAAGFPAVGIHAHVRVGSPAPEITELAGLLGADLVAVGTHGRTGLGRLLMGSVAEAVVEKTSCPVLVVRAKAHGAAGAAA